MNNWYFLENIATMACSVLLVLGLYAMSHSMHALWGLILLLNLNYQVRTASTVKGEER